MRGLFCQTALKRGDTEERGDDDLACFKVLDDEGSSIDRKQIAVIRNDGIDDSLIVKMHQLGVSLESGFEVS